MKHWRVWGCVYALALCAIWPAAASGADARTAETVVVTAGRVEEKAKTVSRAMTVIGNEEMEKNQYRDLGDMLRNNGINVMSYGPNQSMSQIRIRGMATELFGDPNGSKVMILVDGRPIGTTNISMIPTVGIERVEIIRGPAAVQYGTSAMGGVVNVITKRGGKDLHLTAEAGIGSWANYRALGGLSGQAGPVDFSGAVDWSTQQSDYNTSGGNSYPNTAYQSKTSYVLNMGFNFLEEHRLGVTLLGAAYDDMGSPGAIDSSYSSEVDRTDRINSSVDVNYDGAYKDAGLSWKLRYYNAYDQYKIYQPSAWAPDTNFYEGNYQGMQAQVSWNWSFLTLTGGVDWNDSDYADSTGYAPKYEKENAAGFLLAKVALFDEMLVLSGGLRYDTYKYKANSKSEYLDNTSLSAGLAFNPLDWLTFRANIGESFRVPSGIQVVGYSDGWSNYIGNPDLTPEKGLGWDVGVEVAHKGFNAGLTYFSTDYRDEIVYQPVPGSYDYQYVNRDGVSRYRGIEGQISYDLGQYFDWDFMLRPYLSFTHFFQYDDPDGERLMYVRDWDAAFGVNYQHPSLGLEADLRFVYLGFMDETDAYYSTQTRTGGKITADFFVSKTIWNWEEGGKLSVKGEVRNLFNEHYSLKDGYPMPGRSFYVGLRYDF